MIDPQFGRLGLQVCHYRCFGDEPQGFDSVKQVNLVIGRNNTGKSALLDMVRFAVDGFDPSGETSDGGASPNVLILEDTEH